METMFQAVDIDLSLAVIVMIAILIDVITGIVKAVATSSFNSSAMRKGLWHKAGSVALLGLAAFVTIACQISDVFPEEFAIVYVPTCIYIVCMEISSVLENILAINPELDRFKIFQIFGQKEKDAEESLEEINDNIEKIADDVDAAIG